MTSCGETSLVNREAYLANYDNPECGRRDARYTTYHHEALTAKSISLRNLDASCFTLHERRGLSQAEY